MVFVARQMGHAFPDHHLARLRALLGLGGALEQGERVGPRRRLRGLELTFFVLTSRLTPPPATHARG